MYPRRVFVIGGARSGKSALAERLAALHGGPRVYLASAQAFDPEMRARIDAHRARRDGWTTIEAPLDAAGALQQAAAGSVVLFDCATLWLSNQMLAEADIETETTALLAALESCPAAVITVSNEVGLSIVPENPLARRFRDAQGVLNQRLAASADLAVLVAAGLPLVLKGLLPEGAA